MPTIKVSIPYCYVWMTKDNPDRAVLFRRYVLGYIAVIHPDFELVKIQGMTAICKKKEEEGAP